MSIEVIERQIATVAGRFSFVQKVETMDKTANTVKIRLEISSACFVQVYLNVRKGLTSFALVFNRARIFGRDSDGGRWHRHPYEDPDRHDFSPEGSRTVDLEEFLVEVEEVLRRESLW